MHYLYHNMGYLKQQLFLFSATLYFAKFLFSEIDIKIFLPSLTILFSFLVLLKSLQDGY